MKKRINQKIFTDEIRIYRPIESPTGEIILTLTWEGKARVDAEQTVYLQKTVADVTSAYYAKTMAAYLSKDNIIINGDDLIDYKNFARDWAYPDPLTADAAELMRVQYGQDNVEGAYTKITIKITSL